MKLGVIILFVAIIALISIGGAWIISIAYNFVGGQFGLPVINLWTMWVILFLLNIVGMAFRSNGSK